MYQCIWMSRGRLSTGLEYTVWLWIIVHVIWPQQTVHCNVTCSYTWLHAITLGNVDAMYMLCLSVCKFQLHMFVLTWLFHIFYFILLPTWCFCNKWRVGLLLLLNLSKSLKASSCDSVFTSITLWPVLGKLLWNCNKWLITDYSL